MLDVEDFDLLDVEGFTDDWSCHDMPSLAYSSKNGGSVEKDDAGTSRPVGHRGPGDTSKVTKESLVTLTQRKCNQASVAKHFGIDVKTLRDCCTKVGFSWPRTCTKHITLEQVRALKLEHQTLQKVANKLEIGTSTLQQLLARKWNVRYWKMV